MYILSIFTLLINVILCSKIYHTQNTPYRVVATPSLRNDVDKPSTRGASFFMFGKSPKFASLQVEAFVFPESIRIEELELKDERHFIEFLLRNDWVQRYVGVKMGASNGLFPDLKGEIYDNSGDKISVEAEFWAENYARHGHAFRGCDLILSFFRKPETRFVKGVPVWSFYYGEPKDRIFEYCLADDMNYNFDNHEQIEIEKIRRTILNQKQRGFKISHY